MKVPYVEDLANHSSPESCGGYSNGPAEALTGESVGGLLSSEITTIWVPTPCTEGEGHADGSDICELPDDLAESKNLACVDASYAGIRRSERNPALINWNGRIQETKTSWCIELHSCSMQAMNTKVRCMCRAGQRRCNAVRLARKCLTEVGQQHSTREASEQREISTWRSLWR